MPDFTPRTRKNPRPRNRELETFTDISEDFWLGSSDDGIKDNPVVWAIICILIAAVPFSIGAAIVYVIVRL